MCLKLEKGEERKEEERGVENYIISTPQKHLNCFYKTIIFYLLHFNEHINVVRFY